MSRRVVKVHPIIFFCTIAVAIVVVMAIFQRLWVNRPPAPITTFAQEEILGEVAGYASGENWAGQQRGIPSGSQLDRMADDIAPNPANDAWKRGFKRGFKSGYKKSDTDGAKPAFD